MPLCSNPIHAVDVPRTIKGLCPACYQRQWKTGSLYYQPEPEQKPCAASGCGEIAKRAGFCQKHYMRVRRHGHAEETRPNGWGAKSKHPLWEAWKSMTRAASKSGDPGMDPAWADFWAFLDDVGERPAPKARLYRRDRTLPYSKGNCDWREPILDAPKLQNTAAYMRALRAKRPESFRRSERRRLYNMDGDDHFERLLSEQGGTCAICRRPEEVIDDRSGIAFQLAVDHDKRTGAVRGLLCMKHNRALGMFSHNAGWLRAAANYLDAHGTVPDDVEIPDLSGQHSGAPK